MKKVYLKKDIVRYLAKHSGYSQIVSEDVLEAFHELLIDVVKSGDRIQDYGYFDIESIFVPEHYRYDPRSGNSKKVIVKPKFKVKIKVGKTLKDASKESNIIE